MKEDLLHLVWKLKKFDLKNLKTTTGESVQIKNFGFHNHNAGPDFLNAEVLINNISWFGHIEIHVNASEWNDHKHQNDLNYNNVILHVVYKDDKEVFTAHKTIMPTLELANRIDNATLSNYTKLKSSLTWIPCASQIENFDKTRLQVFLEKVLIERLQTKTDRVNLLLENNQNDWEDLLYKMIAKYLGLKVNAEAFAQLSKKTSYRLIHKVSNELPKLEALLLGQAGLFQKLQDDYSKSLSKEYDFLKHKFQLQAMSGLEWKFSRMRPVNFPTVRIAQIAALYYKSPQLFNAILNTSNLKEIYKLLSVNASDYWSTHYILGKESKKMIKTLGEQTKQSIVINAIIPIIFAYGEKLKDQSKKDYALSLIDSMPSEKNKIIRTWKEHSIDASSAAQSQALIQLKTEYCDQFRCLNCNIGKTILFA